MKTSLPQQPALSLQRAAVCLMALMLLAGCHNLQRTAEAPAAKPHDLHMATLWVQTSGEYRALCEQAYTGAEAWLERAISDTSWSAASEQAGRDVSELPPAIIVDVDETVLDNSPYQARLILEGARYDPKTWLEWCALAEAEPVPGALTFLQAADALGVTVFYITNRDASSEEATRQNLEMLGFPLEANRDTLLLKNERAAWTSAKTVRRALVVEDFRILFIAGDDLNDFVSGFKTSDPTQRKIDVAAYQDRFGKEWILLPNPQYGSWEASLFGRDYSLSESERRERMRDHLRAYPHSE